MLHFQGLSDDAENNTEKCKDCFLRNLKRKIKSLIVWTPKLVGVWQDLNYISNGKNKDICIFYFNISCFRKEQKE